MTNSRRLWRVTARGSRAARRATSLNLFLRTLAGMSGRSAIGPKPNPGEFEAAEEVDMRQVFPLWLKWQDWPFMATPSLPPCSHRSCRGPNQLRWDDTIGLFA